MDILTNQKINKLANRVSSIENREEIFVATRCGDYFADTFASGTTTGETYKINHTATANCYDIRLIYGNFRVITSSSEGYGSTLGDMAGLNDITIAGSIEYNGVIYPVTFSGKKTATIQSGGIVQSDPIGLEIMKGTTFYTRNFVQVATNGLYYPTGFYTIGANHEGKTSGNITESGTASYNSAYAYHPIAIIGKCVEKVPSILLVGDSILTGNGDTPIYYGYGARALENVTIGHAKISRPGEKGYVFKTFWGRRYRINMSKYANYAIVEYGINDISNLRTLAQLQEDMTSIWNTLKIRGLKVYQTTITPKTTSTDGWITTTNQSVYLDYESVRTQFNDWIRTCPNPLSGYFEVADVVETSRNSGIWLANYTNDGVHPNATGHIAIASNGIDTSVFN